MPIESPRFGWGRSSAEPGSRRPSRLIKAWPVILAATLVSAVATGGKIGFDWPVPSLAPHLFTVMGIAISIFLGFRNSTAYGRFWEARQQWGKLMNTSRSLARQTLTLVTDQSTGPNSPEQARVVAYQEDAIRAIIAYAHALRHHLYETDPIPQIATLLTADEVTWLRAQDNVPIAILHLLGRRFAWAREQGWLPEVGPLVLENSLSDLTDAGGACERIKNTPVPVTYRVLSRNIVTTFCLLLPFGILDQTKFLTPVMVFLVTYALVGLDYLGEEITDPFGDDAHDLPLERYGATVESNLRQLLSERDLPDLVVPEPMTN